MTEGRRFLAVDGESWREACAKAGPDDAITIAEGYSPPGRIATRRANIGRAGFAHPAGSVPGLLVIDALVPPPARPGTYDVETAFEASEFTLGKLSQAPDVPADG